MSEDEVLELIREGILAHERRVGFVSGVIGTLWLVANLGFGWWVYLQVS